MPLSELQNLEPVAPEGAPVTGTVHSWDLSTGVDGPGTRFVLFTSGCPLRCLYCQNPDTWYMRDGERKTVDEVMEAVDKHARFLQMTHGGVTVSGGEPMLQPRFTSAIFAAAKERGLHTALDTSGFLGERFDEAQLANVDLVLLDIKNMDPDGYRELTGGAELAPTLKFARRLNELGKPMWIRYVLVPGHSDDDASIVKLADFLAELPAVERVDVLGFHKLGAAKYEAMNLPFPLADTPSPTEEQLEAARRRFAERGLVVT